MIEVDGLIKLFGLRPVLRGTQLQVAKGESLALLGANGSGKTTLLRTLAGLSRPTAGQVSVGGWRIPQEAAAIRAHLGVISHLPLLYADLTAEENLRFFARLYNADRARIPALLARVGLEKRAKERVAGFSRGMQQRLSIARALIHDPDVLLLDEPHTGLDVVGAAVLDTLIGELHAEGRTIILTTHDLGRAVRLTDRVAILSRGVIAGESLSADLTPAKLESWYGKLTIN